MDGISGSRVALRPFFYTKKGKFLAEGAIAHTVLQSDIKKTIDPPDIRVRGPRIYYVFNGK